MHMLDADGRWPVFTGPTTDAVVRGDGGYGAIACFVSPTTVDLLNQFPAGVRSLLVERGLIAADADQDEADLAVLGTLWDQLRACRIRYDREPWHPGHGQEIRDPVAVVSRRGSGTCLDLAVLFAALCLRERLKVSLLMQRRDDGSGHTLVVVQTGCAPEDMDALPNGTSRAGHGVLRLNDPVRMASDPDVRVLDIVRAALPGPITFAEMPSAERLLVDGGVQHLVDIGVRHTVPDTHGRRDAPLPPPTRRTVLGVALPTLPPTFTFPSQERLLGRLDETGGTIVLQGPSGTGKSTVALRAAIGVDAGRGWFLPATSPQALRHSLAAAELAERGMDITASDADVQALVLAAHARLRAADGPWVVVLDNADSGPKGLEVRKPTIRGFLRVVRQVDPRRGGEQHNLG